LALQDENSKLKKQIEALLKDKAKSTKVSLKNSIEIIGDLKLIRSKLDLDSSSIKNLAFELNGEIENLVQVYGSQSEGKAILTLMLSKNLVSEKSLNAGKIIRELGKEIQGGGGGQDFFATAGGKKPEGIEKALERIVEFI
jgi:alanyl-tRNA synthetase